MIDRLVECVANISEGRDPDRVDRIATAITGIDGCWVLDIESDGDHNRSVLTFAGAPEAMVEAAVRVAGRCADLIDLNRHRGAHPRIGALDVVPFIPLHGLGMAACAALAVQAGGEIWRRHRVPVYLYGEAARRDNHRRLPDIRRGQFEGLRAAVADDPSRRPDIGGPALHPTAGATAVGARKTLIAYNIQLDTPDAAVAAEIARRVRESSGGLPHVLAMGILLPSRGLAQVSMNLTDFETTPPHVAFEAVAREAALRGVSVKSSELIGLIPQRALELAEERDLLWENLTSASVLEHRLAQVIG